MLKGYVARDEDTRCEIGHQEKLGESYINGCVRAGSALVIYFVVAKVVS